MNQYRIKGLSCGHCAQTMEDEIKKLEFGESATLSYNSGKLTLNDKVSLDKVKKILKSEGAYIEKQIAFAQADDDAAAIAATEEHNSCSDDSCGHGGEAHNHSHDHGGEAHDHDHNHGHTQNTKANDHNHSHSHKGAAHDHSHSHGDDSHGHDHSHEGGGNILKLLIVSAVLYAAALLLDGVVPGYAVIGLFFVATALSGYTTFLRGAKNLFKLKFNIDTLMTVALVGAIAIGEWKEATLVAILFGLNELLEGYGMEKARRSMEALLQVAPKEAIKVVNGQEKVVPIESLRAGDVVRVKPGAKIPSDGTIVEGSSSVNEAAITGESLPVDKTEGGRVFGGSINNEGALLIKIEKAYKDSSLARILHLVEEAQESKTPTELFINRFAKYYTPFIMIVAVLVIVVPPLLIDGDWAKWFYQGLAVLIVGCPCALILSSPIAIVAGITRNARNGILVKGGVHLEQLGKIDTLAFDKTGTLTKGEPHVADAKVYDEQRFYRIAAALEQASSHPLAKAVMQATLPHITEVPGAEKIQALTGRGMKAEVEGNPYWLGNEKSMDHLTLSDDVKADITKMKEQGLTLVIVADAVQVLGIFGIADQIREESREVIRALHKIGIKHTVMLTGDHEGTAAKVAKEVGVTDYEGGLLPEDKVASVRRLAQHGSVAMIGDGINDAPALASAQLGIAMGKGTDSAIETADIVLMQDHLGKLPEAIGISKQVNRIIRFNISVALGLKAIALLLIIPGWLTLWIAILSDMGATIFVTLVSLSVLIQGKKALKR